MGIITDSRGNPVENEEQPEEAKGNGQSGPDMQDVRALPTGTLIYNLCKVTFQEEMGEGAIMQMEMMKKAQKMIADPPPLAAAKIQYRAYCNMRFVVANELNERFAAVDAARAAAFGMALRQPEILGEGTDEPEEPPADVGRD